MVCKIHLIFQPIPWQGLPASWWNTEFLVYATWLDIQGKDSITGMHSLKHMMWSNSIAMGDIFSLNQLQALASIVPKFGSVTYVQLMSRTSSPYSTYFDLNHFFEKDLYYTICWQLSTHVLLLSCLYRNCQLCHSFKPKMLISFDVSFTLLPNQPRVGWPV